MCVITSNQGHIEKVKVARMLLSIFVHLTFCKKGNKKRNRWFSGVFYGHNDNIKKIMNYEYMEKIVK